MTRRLALLSLAAAALLWAVVRAGSRAVPVEAYRESNDGIQVDAGLLAYVPDPGWSCNLCERHFDGFPAWRHHVRIAHLQGVVWS